MHTCMQSQRVRQTRLAAYDSNEQTVDVEAIVKDLQVKVRSAALVSGRRGDAAAPFCVSAPPERCCACLPLQSMHQLAAETSMMPAVGRRGEQDTGGGLRSGRPGAAVAVLHHCVSHQRAARGEGLCMLPNRLQQSCASSDRLDWCSSQSSWSWWVWATARGSPTATCCSRCVPVSSAHE